MSDISVFESGCVVICKGNEYSVEPGTDFVGKVKEIARNNFIKEFRVFLNGDEIGEVGEVPRTFEDGMRVEIIEYNEAA